MSILCTAAIHSCFEKLLLLTRWRSQKYISGACFQRRSDLNWKRKEQPKRINQSDLENSPEAKNHTTMSLLPYFFDDFDVRPRRLFDQHFGLGLTPDDLLTAVAAPTVFNRDYYRPWRHLAAATRDLGASIKADKDKVQINLDVQHFSPEEISVKTADGYIVVEGKHEEKQDEHGFISRQFVRKYKMPEGSKPEAIESKLSSDGVLTITAPKKVPEALKGERVVPIAQTGPVRKEVKDHAEGEIKQKK